MAAEFSKSRVYAGAHRIDEAILRKLIGITASYTESGQEITFYSPDGSDLTANSLDEILEDSSFASAVIKSIRLRSSNYRPSRSVAVAMGENIISDSIRVDVSGSRAQAMALLGEIDNYLTSVENGYSFINKFWGFKVKIAISTTLGVVLSYYVSNLVPAGKFDPIVGTMFLCFMLYMVQSMLENIKDYFYPRVSLRFGLNAMIETRRQVIFRNCFWGLVVAGILGYFVNVLTK